MSTFIHIIQQLRYFCNGDLIPYSNAIFSYLKSAIVWWCKGEIDALTVVVQSEEEKIKQGLPCGPPEMREMFSLRKPFIFLELGKQNAGRQITDSPERQLIVEPLRVGTGIWVKQKT